MFFVACLISLVVPRNCAVVPKTVSSTGLLFSTSSLTFLMDEEIRQVVPDRSFLCVIRGSSVDLPFLFTDHNFPTVLQLSAYLDGKHLLLLLGHRRYSCNSEWSSPNKSRNLGSDIKVVQEQSVGCCLPFTVVLMSKLQLLHFQRSILKMIIKITLVERNGQEEVVLMSKVRMFNCVDLIKRKIRKLSLREATIDRINFVLFKDCGLFFSFYFVFLLLSVLLIFKTNDGYPMTQTFYWRNVTSFRYGNLIASYKAKNTNMNCNATQTLFLLLCCLSTIGIIFGGVCVLFAVAHLFIGTKYPMCCFIEILMIVAFLGDDYFQSPASLGYRLDTGFIVMVAAAGIFLDEFFCLLHTICLLKAFKAGLGECDEACCFVFVSPVVVELWVALL
eukprot:gene5315-3817_t